MRRRTATLTLLAAVAVAACGSSTNHSIGAGTQGTKAQSNAARPPGTVTTTTGQPQPTDAQLKAALLTAADIGPPYTAQPPSSNDNSTVSGCAGLSKDFNSQSPTPGETNEEADFQAGNTGPFLLEVLTTEPEPQFDKDYNQAVNDLKACRSFSVTSSGTTLNFSLTPINFADGATAARMDGSYKGVQLNGYLAFQKIRHAGLVFVYFQIGNGSSQDAYQIYTNALNKGSADLP